jgi:hypothetical protein
MEADEFSWLLFLSCFHELLREGDRERDRDREKEITVIY